MITTLKIIHKNSEFSWKEYNLCSIVIYYDHGYERAGIDLYNKTLNSFNGGGFNFDMNDYNIIFQNNEDEIEFAKYREAVRKEYIIKDIIE